MAIREPTTLTIERSLKEYMKEGKPDGLAWYKFIETVYMEWVDAPPEYRSIEVQP